MWLLFGHFESSSTMISVLVRSCSSEFPRTVVGFDFATTRSSSPGFSSCICLFDMVQAFFFLLDLNGCENIGKLPTLNKRRRWFHSSQVKLPFVSMSASSAYLILDFWVQVDSVKWPIKRNSVGSGNMSHCWTSPAIDDHLDHRFIIFKNVQHCTKLRRLHVWGNQNRRCTSQDRCTELESSFGSWCVLDGVSCSRYPCTFSLDFLGWLEEECNTSITKSQRSRAGIPSMRPSNCVRQKFASCTSNLWEQTCHFQICSKIQPEIDFNPQDRQQSLSLETVLVCIVVQCFPHDNIV